MANDLDAIETLYCAQWHAWYAFIQRRGYTCHQAEDLTQEFFARLLRHKIDLHLRQTAHQCRTYLMKALRSFLANEWHREQCQKRGGGSIPVSLDEPGRQERAELVESTTPEILWDRKWALALLERALDRLCREYAAAGKQEVFDQMRVCLPGAESECDYAELAAALRLSVTAVRMAAHRLRRRYAELVRAEIARTVTDSEDVEEGIRNLIAAISQGWN